MRRFPLVLAATILLLPQAARAMEPEPGSIAAGMALFAECSKSYLPDDQRAVPDPKSAAGVIRGYVEPICRVARMGRTKAMGSFSFDPTTQQWIAENGFWLATAPR